MYAHTHTIILLPCMFTPIHLSDSANTTAI